MSALFVLSVMVAAGNAVAADPVTPVPIALSGLEPGQWDLRSRDPGEPPLHLCVRDFQSLIQIKHPGQTCKRFVVEDVAERASVTYTCPRTGHGQTVVRVETPRLVQIDAQGVADGLPFALDLEGRRTGVCPIPPQK